MPAPHDCNVDGEFVTSRDELARAIERIDQNEAVGKPVGECVACRLLRHDAHTGKKPPKRVQDHGQSGHNAKAVSTSASSVKRGRCLPRRRGSPSPAGPAPDSTIRLGRAKASP